MKNSECELLELAAKAAGYKYSDLVFSDETGLVLLGEYAHKNWNPLRNDGDALRLAVKLGFDIDRTAVGWITIRQVQECLSFASVRIDDDAYTATRLAIVQAAAEIGRMI